MRNTVYLEAIVIVAVVVASVWGASGCPAADSGGGWIVRDAVLLPREGGSFDEVAVKDPSIVFFKGYWHLFYTARSKSEYTTGYVSAKNLNELASAKRRQLKNIKGRKTRYGCAPQVFFFSPHARWYLIYQTRDSNYQPVYSTTKTISNPESWSDPEILVKKDTGAKWIDFWVICDKSTAYLFYTQSHRDIYVRTTDIGDFPAGWGKGKKIFSGVHEAAHVYKARGRQEYHMIYELSKKGMRSFGLAVAEHLAGPWKKITDEYATGAQLRYAKGQKQWTQEASHGEVIRHGYDQLLEYDPENCRWLIQGLMKTEHKGPYTSLPWKLGIISREKGNGKPSRAKALLKTLDERKLYVGVMAWWSSPSMSSSWNPISLSLCSWPRGVSRRVWNSAASRSLCCRVSSETMTMAGRRGQSEFCEWVVVDLRTSLGGDRLTSAATKNRVRAPGGAGGRME